MHSILSFITVCLFVVFLQPASAHAQGDSQAPALKLPQKKKSRKPAQTTDTQLTAITASPQSTSTLNQQNLSKNRDDIRSGWSVGPAFGQIGYDEPGAMNENGTLYGLNAGYALKIDDVALRIDANYIAGKMDYNGGTIATPTTPSSVVTTNCDDTLFDLRTTGHGEYAFNPSISGLWFGGVGMRMLRDRINGSGGYRRDIDYVYLPIGVGGKFNLPNEWSVAASFEHDFFISGQVSSHFEDLNPGNPTIENSQSSAFGQRYSTEIQKSMGSYAVRTLIYYQTWHVDQSSRFFVRDGYFIEPNNSSSLVGMNVAIDL